MRKVLFAILVASVAVSVFAGSVLPTGYDPVDYVGVTGAQYVDLGVMNCDVYGAEMTFSPGSKVYKALLSCNTKQTFYQNGGTLSVSIRGTEQDKSKSVGADSYQAWFDVALKNGYYTFDGTQVKAIDTTQAFNVTEKQNATMKLFSNYQGGSLHDTARCRLLRLYGSGGTLLRDLVPCVRTSDNTPGFYDVADHSTEVGYEPFYASATDTKLVASPLSFSPLTIDRIPAQTYDGEHAYTPVPVVRSYFTDGGVLDASNYDVSYTDNTALGFATVTVTGKGDYAGRTATRHFLIGVAKPFEVLNVEGEFVDSYAKLEAAIAANPVNGTTIELVADAEYDATVAITNKFILRSCADPARNPTGRTFVLRRAAAVTFNVYPPSKDQQVAEIVLTNLVWDGGAEWSKTADVTSLAKYDDLADAPMVNLMGQATSNWKVYTFGTLRMQAGGVLRNACELSGSGAISLTSLKTTGLGSIESSGRFVMEEGSSVVDCRGTLPVVDQSAAVLTYSLLELKGGSIMRCYNSGSAGIVGLRKSTAKQYNSTAPNCIFNGTAITNNIVGGNGAVYCYNSQTSGTTEMSLDGGAPMIRDNHLKTADGALANVYLGANSRLDITQPLETTADVGVRYPAPGTVVGTNKVIAAANEWVISCDSDPLKRAKSVDGNLVWTNRVVIGRPVTLANALDATGQDIDLIAGMPLDRSATYKLIDCEDGITGTFNFTKSTEKGDPVRYWDLVYAADGKSMSARCYAPGFLLIVQ